MALVNSNTNPYIAMHKLLDLNSVLKSRFAEEKLQIFTAKMFNQILTLIPSVVVLVPTPNFLQRSVITARIRVRQSEQQNLGFPVIPNTAGLKIMLTTSPGNNIY